MKATLSNARQPDESFPSYRRRLKIQGKYLKRRLKRGVGYFWHASQGTYRREV